MFPKILQRVFDLIVLALVPMQEASQDPVRGLAVLRSARLGVSPGMGRGGACGAIYL